MLQDVGLPYMLDPRHPEDSLFFVAESDYRFYPEDCISSWYEIVQDETLPSLDETTLEETEPFAGEEEEPSPSPAGEGGDPSPSPEDTAAARRPKKRRYLGWTAAQKTGRSAADVEVSQELRDLVQCCNRAANLGRGHVIWIGWQSAGKRKSVPSFASHLVAVTKHGARQMLASMENGELKKGHWDRVLRSWLVQENYQCPKVMGGSYIWPSCGYYQTHESGCEPGIGERVAYWNIPCVQPGVRPKKAGDRARWLAYWPTPDTGGAVWLEQITFDSRANTWVTQSPPDRWWSTDNDWQRLLWNRWWISYDGWEGPQSSAESKGGKGKGKGKGGKSKQSPSPVNKWKNLCERPDEYEWDDARNRYMPITRLAEQLVVDWDNWDWNGKHSSREWNTRKKHIAMYKRRQFQEHPEEQACA